MSKQFIKPVQKINPTKTNKENGLYSKLRAIRNGDTEAVITFHFIDKVTHNDYGGDDNPKNTKFHVVETKGREWTQVSSINNQVFFDGRGKQVQLDDVLKLFVDLTMDRGAHHFTI